MLEVDVALDAYFYAVAYGEQAVDSCQRIILLGGERRPRSKRSHSLGALVVE